MSYNLFLDDIRMPYDAGNYMYPVELRSQYRLKEWVIVRNYDTFIAEIYSKGLPLIVSLDHDLGEDEATINIQMGMSKRRAKSMKKGIKSGYDCAKWLIEYCIKNNKPLPEFYSHSMNPVGKENILSLLNNFKNIQHENI